MKTPLRWLLVALLSVAAVAAVMPVLWDRAPPVDGTAPALPTAATLERGRVLALAGNCAHCHTARGGAAYAGGRPIDTPFGTVFAGNLTPDPDTGLGRWTAAEFWRALHHGRGADGRRLVPAFPYTQTTRITREDSDALWAWLRTVPAVNQANRQHELRWPYGTQSALAVWRTLFFSPGVWQDDSRQSASWNRGAYLVNGAGHCAACHGGRNAWGGSAGAGFGGGLIPNRHWYAPALNRADQAGVAHWPLQDIVALLRDGSSPSGQATGPMADVVLHSTQHLPPSDLQAMAVYLKSLPADTQAPAPARLTDPANLARAVGAGAALYRDHCAACHGTQGEGGVLADGRRVIPPLAGNRTVTQDPPANLVRSIALGGFGAPTAGNPRPFSMPPFAQVLSEAQIADVATFLRRSWGAQGGSVSAHEVSRWRGGEGD
jgi:mono/diheme cytochrome c family protein